jgi:hypothetical protein
MPASSSTLPDWLRDRLSPSAQLPSRPGEGLPVDLRCADGVADLRVSQADLQGAAPGHVK